MLAPPSTDCNRGPGMVLGTQPVSPGAEVKGSINANSARQIDIG